MYFRACAFLSLLLHWPKGERTSRRIKLSFLMFFVDYTHHPWTYVQLSHQTLLITNSKLKRASLILRQLFDVSCGYFVKTHISYVSILHLEIRPRLLFVYGFEA